jgi:predicted  nucleic acid-binding Zn-ribbon protein
VTALEKKVLEAEAGVEAVESAQAGERAQFEERRLALEAELAEAHRQREASAEQIDKPLRTRYDRLRRSRARDVVVPLVGGTCGACHTSIPLNRRSQIRSGAILDGCEGCGAILYPPDEGGSG